ncbi:MAG: 3-phosphoshikimate 1-carboxyvinyltransferase [Phycisphaera sp.]|nr:3-phosphoshikimate 1-carboxyvinyltransferase [Phycisphaera sp.]
MSDGRAPARAVAAFAPRDLGRLAARIRVPGSKSLTNRHLVLAALADGESVLRGALRSDDCDRLCAALAAMGARFSWTSADTVRVEGVAGRPRGGVRVDLGDGGTPTRFMLAVAALAAEDSEIDGSARMRERPVGEGVDLLVALGARAAFPQGGHALPVVIGGPLRGGAVDIGRTASSQFVSALMLVAPWMPEGLDIRFTDEPTSASYLALSLGALAAHGVDAATGFAPTMLSAGAGAGLRSVAIAPTRVKGAEIDIEPDASSAVYPAALAALVGGEIVLEGLPRRSVQPDSFFLDDLALRGVEVLAADAPDGGVACRVRAAVARLRARDADYARAPDAAVMAMVLAACGDGPSRFTGLETLRVKESDRIESVAAGLRALGGRVETGADWAIVHPLPERVVPATVAASRDHRVAMAFAVLGSLYAGVAIDDPSVVEKSWPAFWEALDLLRSQVSRQNGGR